MFIFCLAAIHCLFFRSTLISLHLSAFVIHQPGAFLIYIIMYCVAFLHLLFFPSTADRVVGNNPQTHQITISLFTAFKKSSMEFGSVQFVQLFMAIWTDIGKSKNIHELLYDNELSTINHCSPEICREYIVLPDICCSLIVFFIPKRLVISSQRRNQHDVTEASKQTSQISITLFQVPPSVHLLSWWWTLLLRCTDRKVWILSEWLLVWAFIACTRCLLINHISHFLLSFQLHNSIESYFTAWQGVELWL